MEMIVCGNAYYTFFYNFFFKNVLQRELENNLLHPLARSTLEVSTIWTSQSLRLFDFRSCLYACAISISKVQGDYDLG